VTYLAERLIANVGSLSEHELGHPGQQTVSIGALTLAESMDRSLQTILNQVDQALYKLYEAKQQGRNQVHYVVLNMANHKAYT
jgi:GGDEF domain-containing protein